MYKPIDTVAASICEAANAFDAEMVATNFLRLAPGSLPYIRFTVGSHLFAYLLCDSILLNLAASDKRRCLEISRLVGNRCIDELAPKMSIPLTDLIIWQEESSIISNISSSIAPPPLEQVITDLYIDRMLRMTKHMLCGASDVCQRGGGFEALYMPSARSLILQITADQQKASDDKFVFDFVLSFSIEFLVLHTKMQEALK